MTDQTFGPGHLDGSGEALRVHPRQLDDRNSPGYVGQHHHCGLPEVGRAGQSRDSLDRAEAPTEPVEVVHAHVQHQAARADGVPVPPSLPAWRPRHTPAFCHAGRPDLAGFDHLGDAGIGGEIAHHVTYGQFHTSLLAPGQGISSFGRRAAEGLFAEHVASCPGRFGNQAGVCVSGRGHDDGAGPAGVEQPFHACTDGDALALAEVGQGGRHLERGQPADLGAGQAQEGAQVDLRHPSTSHQSDPHVPTSIGLAVNPHCFDLCC